MPIRHRDHVADIHSSGLKATTPRLKIMAVMQNGTRRHWTAEDIYRALMAEQLDIALATVYRVLMQFEQAGLVTRLHFEPGKAVFELNEGEHHDHLVCLRCGRVEEFCDPDIEALQRKIASDRGFELQEHVLALYGYCSAKDCVGSR